jgi:hypothetical protein
MLRANMSFLGAMGDGRSAHATRAASKLRRYYTPELARVVADKFREDFERFGYSTDLFGPGEYRAGGDGADAWDGG